MSSLKITDKINNKYNTSKELRKLMRLLIGLELDEGFADVIGNIVGYIGMFLCVFAFFMVQKNNPNMLVYNIINLVASSCLFFSLCIHFNIASI